jgi:ribosomal protein S18 acetylase RimI-like enzyme
MAILPEARGRGGGRALLEAIIGHAVACGAHKLELEVWPDNAPAIALYKPRQDSRSRAFGVTTTVVATDRCARRSSWLVF